MGKSSEHLPPGHLAEQYWVESRRPLASLVFLAPLLIAYEAGVLLLGVQNGADAFLRRLLDLLGFGQHFLLPLLMVCILLAWHYLAREPWRLSGGIISGMAVECVGLGICLRVILFLQDMLFHVFDDPVALSIGDRVKEAVGLLGAGIYEELLFRLILLSLLALGAAPPGRRAAAGHDRGRHPHEPVVRRRPQRRSLWRAVAGVSFHVPRAGRAVLCGRVPLSRLRHRRRAAMPPTTSWRGSRGDSATERNRSRDSRHSERSEESHGRTRDESFASLRMTGTLPEWERL